MPNGASTFWGFFPCRADELDVIIKLQERTIASGTILSAKQLLKENEGTIFTWVDDRFTIKLADKLRVNLDGRSIWIRYVWK